MMHTMLPIIHKGYVTMFSLGFESFWFDSHRSDSVLKHRSLVNSDFAVPNKVIG